MLYTLPAEWSQQSGVMLTWPHEHSDWQPILDEVEPVFVEIAREVTHREKLLIVCYDTNHRKQITSLLSGQGIADDKIIYSICPSNDSWARDHGPITVFENSEPVLLDFQFNGWGNKYPHELDNKITQHLFSEKLLHATRLDKIDLVLEGGSIDVNGKGLLLTTKQCLLTDTRNPGLDQQQIENRLTGLFGIEKTIWLEHGHLLGDDTDAHIDTLARFCDEDTIVYTFCKDRNDAHYDALKAMENDLKTAAAEFDNRLKLIALPLPDAIFNTEGQRLPATYANFLIINDAVLAPVYDCPADREAMDILRQCFSNRDIIEINCRPLIQQFGSLHCVTMQLPNGII